MEQPLLLAQALRATPSACIAFVGAGGKTTGMFQLARQLPLPVIVTATSHLGIWQTELADQHIIAQTPAALETLERGIQGVVLVTGERDGERTAPIPEGMLQWLREFCRNQAIPLLIEADGSRQRPIKAWADHEPPIPAFIDMVVQVVGLTGIGQPLRDSHVHRERLFSRYSGLAAGDPITPEAVVRVLAHAEGGLRNIPPHARKVVLLNQADTPELQSIARGMAGSLILDYDAAIIASLKQEQIFAVYESIAGVILAAGESKRFGQPKQLLDWKGEPFVRAVAKTGLQAGLSPVIVVTGANAEGVEAAVAGLDVALLRNEDWRSGQAGSIRAAVEEILDTSRSGAVIFLLADQPQLTSSILRGLLDRHAQGLYPIVAPMVMDQRANPVLFDRVTFQDLAALEGDVGGRAIFHKYRVDYLPWHDDRLLLDVDTPEMYQRLISDDSL